MTVDASKTPDPATNAHSCQQSPDYMRGLEDAAQALVTRQQDYRPDTSTWLQIQMDIRAIRALIATPPTPADPVREAEACFDAMIVAAKAEAEKAMRKFPQPNYVITKFAEESGEVVKAAVHCAEGRETADNVRCEIKQAVAMLYRLYIEGDQVHGLRALAGDAELQDKNKGGE